MRKTIAARGAVLAMAWSCWLLTASRSEAVTMTFGAAKDATLYESATGALSGGGDDSVFIGRTGQASGAIRRGLFMFDLSSIPAGSTINTVSLSLFVTKTSIGAAPTTMTMHRLLGDWGEGNVVPLGEGGGGANAAAGDATWLHQFRPSDLWNAAGGDFVAQASASTTVGSAGSTSTWNTTSQLVADVQGWINNPAANFGWLLRGNETTSRTARRFASRENSVANNRPLLTIDFTPPVIRTPGDINNDGMVNAVDAALLAGAYGTTTTANNFDLGEFSGDGIVGIADLAILQRNFSPLAQASPATVPEPGSSALVGSALVLAGGIAVWRRRSAVGHGAG